MNRTQKGIIYSLGGVAALAGAYYYFRYRNKDYYNSYEYQLKQFQREFFKCDIMKLSSMQIKFEQLFIKSTLDEADQNRNILERLQYQGTNSEEDLEKFDSCQQHLKCGASYYECWDCSIVRQEIAKSNKKSEEQCIYMTVCEDCFDIQKHKGHHYTRHQASNEEIFRCSCGDQAFMQRDNFCSKHLGYDNLIKVFELEEKRDPKLWELVEKFFLDQFHIAFDTASSLLYQTILGKTDKTKSIQTHLNTFLGFIFDKINEIIELNKTSMVFFTRLFQKSLTKPVQIQIGRRLINNIDWRLKLTIMGKSQINKELSILDYILVFSKLINTKNDQIIATMLRKFIKVDDNFRNFFSEKFFKYIFFAFKTEIRLIQNSEKQVIRGALPPLAHMMIEQVSLMSVFNHLVDKLGEEIFTPIDLFIEYLQTKPPQVLENDEVIYLLYNICFEMLKQINMLKIILTKFYKQMIEKLFTLSYKLFIKNSIKIQKTSNQQGNYFLNNIMQVYESLHLQNLEPQVLLCFINLYEGIILINDEKLNQEVIPFLCDVYSKTALSAYLCLEKMNEQGICLINLSLSFLIQLPLLIALSERKMFTKEVVCEFFKKHFMLGYRVDEKDNEEEAERKKKQNHDILLKAMNNLLNSFLLLNSQTSFYQEMKLTQKRVNTNTVDGQQLLSIIQYTIDYLISPSMRIYDFFTLTYQLLSLAIGDDILQTNSTVYHKHLAFFEKAKESSNFIFVAAETTYTVAQMFLDSSPFLNVFANTLNIYFPEFKESQQNNPMISIQNNQIDQEIQDNSSQSDGNHQEIQLNQNKSNEKMMSQIIDNNGSEQYWIYRKNLNQIMVSIIQARGKKKMFIKDVEQFCKSILHYPSSLGQYAQDICKTHSNQSIAENEDILLLPQYEFHCYPKNFIRVYDDLYRVIQQIQSTSENSLELYPFIGSDHNLNSLFQYQIDLIKRVIFNISYQKYLISLVSEESKYHHIAFFFSLQVYLTLHYLLEYKSSQNNSIDSLVIKEILEIYQNTEIVSKIQKQIEEEVSLSKKRLTDNSEKQMLKCIVKMLDQLNSN